MKTTREIKKNIADLLKDCKVSVKTDSGSSYGWIYITITNTKLNIPANYYNPCGTYNTNALKMLNDNRNQIHKILNDNGIIKDIQELAGNYYDDMNYKEYCYHLTCEPNS